jgi:transposase
MRGVDEQTGELFSYVNLEKRVRSDHPLRSIRGLVNDALVALEQEFAALYAPIGRPSIPPEKLLRAMLLQAFYSIRSERQLMERLEFDLLFRWFVGIGVDDAAWDHSVFSKNRERLLEGDIAAKLLSEVLAHPRLDYRSRGEALSQRAWQRGQALLHGACPDGEPQRTGGRRLFDASRWARRARRSATHDRAARRSAAGDHAGCRQGL